MTVVLRVEMESARRNEGGEIARKRGRERGRDLTDAGKKAKGLRKRVEWQREGL